MNDPILTPRQVAEMFGVGAKQVARWANSGKLRSFRTLGGHRRFRLSDVEAALAEAQEWAATANG